ncbi:acyl CoA synthetase, long chain fatty acid:CoA ligase [Legionella lansingensis]|uniref:Acyl CoA synthetase, long chain fatty acid:CoA ligase n=1 Tax=Legionella lansingensis TaxID=45067 RepID=A0A0W0VJC9_9GAMM|nr:class I adenylate-forming enzyme family protein [Legionella lansingensis]KTD20204.1 acyl CoA synthetase, long chain fatty acid:CoA ligase [Legionella lansingensis]SNV48373.1 acyl CoA synthetase, long chain fatty acid:CoA ligase [Legionella lansingensis]
MAEKRIEQLIFSETRFKKKCSMTIAGNSISYEKLFDAVDHIATHFLNAALSGNRIAFMLPNGLEIIATYLACFKSGCVAMPVNRRYAPPEFERVLQDAQPIYLIIEAEKLFLLEKINLPSTGIKKIFVVGESQNHPYLPFNALLSEPANLKKQPLFYEEPAVIFYTSGSTGQPKGVVHTLSSIEAMLDSTSLALENITTEDKLIICEPQCHVSGFIETFSTLSRGGTALVNDGFDVDWYLATVMCEKPTLAVHHIDTFIKLLDSGRCSAGTFKSFRGIYTGGDTLPAAVQNKFLACAGKPIQVGYGMTEAIWLTICRNPDLIPKACIGKPIAGVKLRLVNSTGEEVRCGEMGEIQVKGDMVMHSYWDNPKATRQAFAKGWFKTGDCAIQDEQGDFYYTGRIKNIIIRNTSNIMPGEVEAAIYNHPAVSVAAVIGVPDDKEGEVPVAFVVIKNDKQLTREELNSFLLGQIAQYKIPAKIYFIDKMPVTNSGKINHKKLYDYL